MEKAPQAFRTIGEASEWLGVQPHVLRFWESRFSQIRPVKRRGGRRYYRPEDLRLLAGIRHLLHEEGMTIRGVQKLLREKGVAHVASMADPQLVARLEGGAAEPPRQLRASEDGEEKRDRPTAPASSGKDVGEKSGEGKIGKFSGDATAGNAADGHREPGHSAAGEEQAAFETAEPQETMTADGGGETTETLPQEGEDAETSADSQPTDSSGADIAESGKSGVAERFEGANDRAEETFPVAAPSVTQAASTSHPAPFEQQEEPAGEERAEERAQGAEIPADEGAEPRGELPQEGEAETSGVIEEQDEAQADLDEHPTEFAATETGTGDREKASQGMEAESEEDQLVIVVLRLRELRARMADEHARIERMLEAGRG